MPDIKLEVTGKDGKKRTISFAGDGVPSQSEIDEASAAAEKADAGKAAPLSVGVAKPQIYDDGRGTRMRFFGGPRELTGKEMERGAGYMLPERRDRDGIARPASDRLQVNPTGEGYYNVERLKPGSPRVVGSKTAFKDVALGVWPALKGMGTGLLDFGKNLYEGAARANELSSGRPGAVERFNEQANLLGHQAEGFIPGKDIAEAAFSSKREPKNYFARKFQKDPGGMVVDGAMLAAPGIKKRYFSSAGQRFESLVANQQGRAAGGAAAGVARGMFIEKAPLKSLGMFAEHGADTARRPRGDYQYPWTPKELELDAAARSGRNARAGAEVAARNVDGAQAFQESLEIPEALDMLARAVKGRDSSGYGIVLPSERALAELTASITANERIPGPGRMAMLDALESVFVNGDPPSKSMLDALGIMYPGFDSAAGLKPPPAFQPEQFHPELTPRRAATEPRRSPIELLKEDFGGARDIANAPRSLMYGGDVSAIARQGAMLGLSNPKAGWKATKAGLGSLASEKYAAAVRDRIHMDPVKGSDGAAWGDAKGVMTAWARDLRQMGEAQVGKEGGYVFHNAVIPDTQTLLPVIAKLEQAANAGDALAAKLSEKLVVGSGEIQRLFPDEVKLLDSLYPGFQNTAAPRMALYQHFGLAVDDASADMFRSNIVEKVPVLGSAVKRFQAAWDGHLGTLRKETFDAQVDAWEKLGIMPDTHPQKFRAIADWLNTASGHGDLGLLDPVKARAAVEAKTLSPEAARRLGAVHAVMSEMAASPRLQAAKYNMVRTLVDPRVPREIKLRAAKEMGIYLAANGALVAAAVALGYKVEQNATSTNWGKIEVKSPKGDKTYIDLWGGLQPWARLIAQTAARQKNKKPLDAAGMATLYGKRGEAMLAPTPSLLLDLIRQTDYIGQPTQVDRAFLERSWPLAWQDMSDAIKAHGKGKGIGLGALGLMGEGVSTYAKERPRIQ